MAKTSAKIAKNNKKLADKEHKEILGKCVPIAQEALAMVAKAGLDMTEEGSVKRSEGYSVAAKDLIQMFLDKNLRWIDRSLIFQLAKQPLDVVQNVLIEQEKGTEEEQLDAEVAPVSEKLLAIVAEAGLGMGDDVAKADAEKYLATAKKVADLFKEHGLKRSERRRAFAVAMKPISILEAIALTDLQKTFEYQISSLFGISSFEELDLKKLDETLKLWAKFKLSAKEQAEAGS